MKKFDNNTLKSKPKKPTTKGKTNEKNKAKESKSDNNSLKSKSKNTTSKGKSTPKKVCDIYTDLFSLRKVPIMDEFFERLARDLVHWAANDKNALNLKQFTTMKGIPWNTFFRWTKVKKPIMDVYQDVKLMIAMRREKGMLEGKYKEKSGMHIQHVFDKDWAKASEFWAALNKKDEEKNPNIRVVVEPFDQEKNE